MAYKMVVQLKFFAGLRNYLPAEPFPYPAEVKEGATVADVLALYKVPEDKPHILLLNGVHCDLAARLSDGDTLSLFPPVAGG
jgi:molybdopterin converting factor small subunit